MTFPTFQLSTQDSGDWERKGTLFGFDESLYTSGCYIVFSLKFNFIFIQPLDKLTDSYIKISHKKIHSSLTEPFL